MTVLSQSARKKSVSGLNVASLVRSPFRVGKQSPFPGHSGADHPSGAGFPGRMSHAPSGIRQRPLIPTGPGDSMRFHEGGERVNETLERRAEAIRAWNVALPVDGVELYLVRTGDERTARIEAFLNALAGLAPKVRVHGETAESGALPGIRVPPSWTFHGVPEGTELDPFLDLVTRAVTGEAGVSGTIRTTLEGVEMPSIVDLYVATQCPNCPRVLGRIAPFPLVNPRIRVRVFDGVLFSEQAREQGIRAVPTILLAHGLRYTGQVGADEVAEGLLQGDPSRMRPEAFAHLIQAGDAQGLAGMMLQKRQVFPAVLDLLAGDLFSLRLGAMVAMEEIGEKDPDLAREALEPLWERMAKANPSARGDIVYLVGELGDVSWRPRLRELLQGEVPPDLREAVQDALASLKG